MDLSNKTVVTIEGKQYIEEQLPEKARNLVNIFKLWSNKLGELRLDAAMVEAAIKQLSIELNMEIQAAGVTSLDSVASTEPPVQA